MTKIILSHLPLAATAARAPPAMLLSSIHVAFYISALSPR